MKVGVTFDLRADYGIAEDSLIFSDFCQPDEIGYMQRAIERNGYEADMIGNMYKLRDRIKEGTLDCDIILVCDEGISSRNREAIVPALLELNDIPYVGSDAYAMALSQNKYHTKLIAEALGIRCPKGIYVEYKNGGEINEDKIMKKLSDEGLSFPLLVKPNEEGYSMGVYLVKDKEKLFEAIRSDFGYYHEPVLVEEFIGGKETFVAMIGTGDGAYTLPVGQITNFDGTDIEFYSVEAKRFDYTLYSKANLPAENCKKMEENALKLYRHLGCRDFGRVDFRLDENGDPVLIEITPRPGLSEEGPYEICAKALGKTYDDILKEIIDTAALRYGIKG
ncbi:D-alanine--D-alanine ligase family protein [Butyrivibrio sp. NC2002]|uniref:D-alanine--D-alanine ligase family protein n=1 Tax=Butyrivibrio sp. NC2002 TaxID=1410610 RepID=UPI00056D3C28|nr:ATP-grasp domain-containing protein [Butyrivibrio sp. NC2002]